MNNIDIAKHFSLGQFSQIFQYLDDEILWNVIGESTFSGKLAVIEQTQKIESYFQSVTHHFELDQIHLTDPFIIIQGQAIFQSSDQITKISACDIYQFNQSSQIIKIQSYCIPLKSE
ncbi:MAG: nuclear transport factor 2 family protein [Acinetobacter sp.]|nr:nuclear transport factor 2 family protein [Acinetobacter sp.]